MRKHCLTYTDDVYQFYLGLFLAHSRDVKIGDPGKYIAIDGSFEQEMREAVPRGK
jgi:hypothetical protein